MNSTKRLPFLLLLTLLIGCAPFVLGQGTDLGTITGIVTDPSGALVPNAKVVIVDLSTNSSRETTTNVDGAYRVFGLSSGRYQVSVSMAGMRPADATGVSLNGS